MSNYILTSTTIDSQKIEFYDNALRLCDLKLFHLYFKLVELEENHEEKELNANISKLIGFNVDELKIIKDPEILEYRLELFECVSKRLREENIDIVANKGLNLLSFKSRHVPNIEVDPNEFLLSRTSSSQKQLTKKIEITIYDETNISLNKIKQKRHGLNESDFLEKEFSLSVSLDLTPVNVIGEYFKQKYTTETTENIYQFQKTY